VSTSTSESLYHNVSIPLLPCPNASNGSNATFNASEGLNLSMPLHCLNLVQNASKNDSHSNQTGGDPRKAREEECELRAATEQAEQVRHRTAAPQQLFSTASIITILAFSHQELVGTQQDLGLRSVRE